MPASTDFSTDIEQRLEALDAIVAALGADLSALAALREEDAAAAPRRLTALGEAIADLRVTVVAAAADVGLVVPGRADRGALRELIGAIYGRLVAREALQRRRAGLRELAEELAAGGLEPRPARRRPALEVLRQQAVTELLQLAEGEAPELPGPEAATWLGWAWSLEEPGLSEMLDELSQGAPQLTEFVQQMQPAWWVSRPRPEPPETTPEPPTPSGGPSRSGSASEAAVGRAGGGAPAVAASPSSGSGTAARAAGAPAAQEEAQPAQPVQAPSSGPHRAHVQSLQRAHSPPAEDEPQEPAPSTMVPVAIAAEQASTGPELAAAGPDSPSTGPELAAAGPDSPSVAPEPATPTPEPATPTPEPATPAPEPAAAAPEQAISAPEPATSTPETQTPLPLPDAAAPAEAEPVLAVAQVHANAPSMIVAPEQVQMVTVTERSVPVPLFSSRATGPVPVEFVRVAAPPIAAPPVAASPVSEPAAPAEPAEPSEEWPDELRSYDAFREHYWIDATDACARVPWAEPAFRLRLDAQMADELHSDRLCRMWIFARAAQALDAEPLIAPRDLESLAEIYAAPLSATAGLDEERPRLLRRALQDSATLDSPLWRVRAVLEAVAPSRLTPLIPAEAEDLLERIQLRDAALHLTIQFLLQKAAAGPLALRLLREHLADPEDAPPLQVVLEDERARLYALLSSLWSVPATEEWGTSLRAGRAWARFFADAFATLQPLCPTRVGGATEWDPSGIERLVLRLPGACRAHAESLQVRPAELRQLLRRARQLADAGAAVNDLMRRIAAEHAGGRPDGPGAGGGVQLLPDLPSQEIRALLRARIPRADEELCRRLLCRLLAGATPAGAPRSEAHPLDLTVADLCRYPGLLGLLDQVDEDALHAGGPAAPVARCSDLRDPLRAAGLLLQPDPIADEEAHIDGLRHRLWQRGRTDLLGLLTRGMLPHEQAQVHAERAALTEQLYPLLAEARRSEGALWALSAPVAAEVCAACDQAESVLNDLSPDREARTAVFDREGAAVSDREHADGAEAAAPVEPALLNEYLSQIIGLSQEAERAARAALLRQAAAFGDPVLHEAVDAALAAGRPADARGLLGEDLSLLGDDLRSPSGRRQTPFRGAAAIEFRDPSARLSPSRVRGDAAGTLVEAWRRGAAGAQADWGLRQSFGRAVFSARRGESRLFAAGTSSSIDYRLPCVEVRAYLSGAAMLRGVAAPAGRPRTTPVPAGMHAPSFLPQLRGYTHLTVLTPPVPVTAPDLAERTAELCARYPDDLSVVLAPRLPAEARDAVIAALLGRGAVLDDLDLCRLLNPDGLPPDPLLSLLEIALEQLPPAAVSPYADESDEMFVGRRAEARALGLLHLLPDTPEPWCARLFAGRGLGKTALLHFVQTSEDRRATPDGLLVRALPVSLLGAATDAEVATRIVEALRGSLRLQVRAPAPDDSDPGEALLAALRRFLATPGEALLLLLDDADDFAEAQARAYLRDPRAPLLLRIRELLQPAPFAAPPPTRVRLVLAGSRATRGDAGPWAHTAAEIRLGALLPAESAALIEGPLCRLGIDARQQAPAVAYLCGHHPAVLRRFGQELVAHLHHPAGLLPDAVVSADDVGQVFRAQGVQAALRAAVKDNLAADRRGRVLFLALVLEFAEMVPGATLTDGPRRVLDRLQMIDADTSWLLQEDEPAQGVIAGYLDDLSARGVLTETPRGYRLRVPQHLPLFRGEVEATLLDEIERLRVVNKPAAGVSPAALAEVTAGAPLPGESLRALRALLRGGEKRLVVLGTVWPTLQGQGVGLWSWLGIAAGDVLTSDDLQAPSGRLYEPRRVAVVGCSAELAERLWDDPHPHSRRRGQPGGPPPLLLCGGADLLRWGLQRAQRERGVAVCPTGRLSRRTVRAWLSRLDRGRPLLRTADGRVAPARADAGTLDLVQRYTGGVPLLCRQLDEALQGAGGPRAEQMADALGGADPGALLDDLLGGALLQCERELGAHGWQLLEGPPAVRLTAREQQLLRMVVTVSREAPGKPDLRRELAEGWSGYRDQHPELDYVAALTPADHVALSLLQHLGLLPVNEAAGAPELPFERLALLPAGDPLMQLMAELGAAT